MSTAHAPTCSWLQRLLLAACAAVCAVNASAADDAAFERVVKRLSWSAGPWCDRMADLDANGVRRCRPSVKMVDELPTAAYAFMGQQRINRSSMERVNEPQLAAVLGHEMAHSLLGHGLFNVRRLSPHAIHLLGLLERSEPHPHPDTPDDPRARELDADLLGLYLAGLAGYRVFEVATMADRLPDLHPTYADVTSTHPKAKERKELLYRAAVRFCEQLRKGQLLQPDPVRLHVTYESREEEVRARQNLLVADDVCAPAEAPQPDAAAPATTTN
ncbi:MAG: M48 family metalloprotease [Inhella sp.]|jgi:hypothetical protein|uniref:M48 family metalloprotease n=1 Tax=Inhella sp. TaxID=1921806 RepID=UPI0022C5B669|nr:M48 family metalloprotease [Inhella sp.]MCZ8236211.1 M48 family metalloprotease [Inhella sp.]